MQIVIAHSHLNPGGVTRIIHSQLESLHGETVKVLVGDCPEPEAIQKRAAELVIFEPLHYLENRKYSNDEAKKLLDEILVFMENQLNKDSILHFHNLNLGKNPVVTYAVYLLAKIGIPVFNHAHDFAEDRPANYQFLQEIIVGNFREKLNEVLYPDLPNYHFGALNASDVNRLISYGVARERIEWLPNPVPYRNPVEVDEKKAAKNQICKALQLNENKLLVTYPVRVIQRKNIGELILLSVLFAERVNFTVTQPPKNPVEIERYKKWLDFCQKEKINVVFEAGNKVDFEELLVASDFCITTSYKEGFGMVYLEPWLFHSPVVGRNIDYITIDFINDGFQFPALYNTLVIPGFQEDFKDLSAETQMQIITDVQKGKIQKTEIFEQNKTLITLFEKVDLSIIEKNSLIIKNNYSLKGYGIKLQKRYKKMVG